MKIRKNQRPSPPSSSSPPPQRADFLIPRQGEAHAPPSAMNDKELESPGPTVAEELRGAPPPPPCAVDAGGKKECAGAAPPPVSVGEKEECPPEAGAAGLLAQSGGGDKDEAVDDAAVGRPSDGGGKRKDGILEPIDGGRRVAVPEEKDGIVGGELMAVSEAAVAEERKQATVGGELMVVAGASVADGDEKKKKDGLLGADSGVTIAVAGNGGEKGLGRKEGDGVVTVAIAPRKQGIPRTSCYHGVTRHRWTGKYEAHLWDGSINIESRKRKGKQVYLGGYDTEEKAARAYDLAALKYWGVNAGTKLNFPISDYEKELEEMKNMNQDEWVAYLRRRSTCFSRGVSAYRGVTRRRKDGKWQARLGSVAGTRDIYLGAFNTEEEAAVAYDIAAVELRGPTAVTNFDISNYLEGDVRRLETAPSVKL